ncbi:MAG: class I SAM-dependent methyltransferase [Myxococcales bacterium]|nr:class I SAM-dependent methyltransferase [Myxococcales bacterium]
MVPIVSDALERYAHDHTDTPDPIYERLREETFATIPNPQMQVGRVEGRLLRLLVALCGARRAVEIGTFTGYSGLCIAEALSDDGELISCELLEAHASLARRYFAEAPWGKKIDLRMGPALETLASIEGAIDFAFIDADKERYIDYWDALVPMLRPGGLIVVDNVLWSGKVLRPEHATDRAIAALNDHAMADARMEIVMLTVRDGLLLGRKREASR